MNCVYSVFKDVVFQYFCYSFSVLVTTVLYIRVLLFFIKRNRKNIISKKPLWPLSCAFQCANAKRWAHIYLRHDKLHLWKFWLWALCQDSQFAQGKSEALSFMLAVLWSFNYFIFFTRWRKSNLYICSWVLQGAFPARLKCVFIVSSPLWFRAPFAVLRLFVREKLRERVLAFIWLGRFAYDPVRLYFSCLLSSVLL